LHISPDIDIVAYTLSGLVDDARGWGIQGDTFNSLDMMRRYGESVWFNLGDRDLATHLLRTQQLRAGLSLTAITAAQCTALGITSRILPMCDQPVPSMIRTPAGYFHFQEYLVQRGGREDVIEVVYQDVAHASPALGVLDALSQAEAILICPSNPIISVGTILAVPGIRAAIRCSAAPVVAISPIIQGATLKGPADLMLQGLGFEVSAYGVAQYYDDLLSGYILDTLDASLGPRVEALGLRVEVTNSIMKTLDDKVALARAALTLARACS
jgi:LPPG:FO 2-phospho-L-lactate transferase